MKPSHEDLLAAALDLARLRESYKAMGEDVAKAEARFAALCEQPDMPSRDAIAKATTLAGPVKNGAVHQATQEAKLNFAPDGAIAKCLAEVERRPDKIVTAEDVAAATGIENVDTVRSSLSRLAKFKRIQRVGFGKYKAQDAAAAS